MRRDLLSLKYYYVAMILVALFSIWIRTGFPIYAITTAAYDDQLFIRAARYLEAGQWLGPYDNLTLAKGMFYPLFIVIAFWTSVPLKIAEHLVYLAVSAMTARLVRRQMGSNQLSLLLFVFLSFNPVFWNIHLARVIREGLYVSLSLAVVVLVVMISFPAPTGKSGCSRSGAWVGCCLGVTSAAFWMTREEGIWLLPAVIIIISVALISALHPTWNPPSERILFPDRSARIRAIALPLALGLAVFVMADWLVAEVNYRHYGIFETNEIRSKSFLRAYGAISRIQHDRWHRYVPFPKDARLRAYSVSPAARELTKSYEGPTGDTWLQITCSWVNTKPCVEVQAGWEMWELRNAVADAGHYRSAPEAMKFYDELADQINSACDHGTIACLPRRDSMLPPFRWEYLAETLVAAKSVADVTFTMGKGKVGSASSIGSPEGIASFSDIVGGVYVPKSGTIAVQGWIASTTVTPAIRLVGEGQEHWESSLDILPAPDVLAAYPMLKAVRFALKTNCPAARCSLLVDIGGAQQRSIPLSQLTGGTVLNVPDLRIQIDNSAVGEHTELTDFRRAIQVRMAAAIASAYALSIPILAILGSGGLLLATVMRRACPIPTGLLALGLGSACAVATRIALLAYIDATSFGVADLLYTSPASPFIIVFATIGLYSWYVVLHNIGRRLIRGQRSSPPRIASPDYSRPVSSREFID